MCANQKSEDEDCQGATLLDDTQTESELLDQNTSQICFQEQLQNDEGVAKIQDLNIKETMLNV